MIYLQTFTVAISRPLGATSRVIFELKPFGISIRGANGSQPWVGRSTAQMSGNPNGQFLRLKKTRILMRSTRAEAYP